MTFLSKVQAATITQNDPQDATRRKGFATIIVVLALGLAILNNNSISAKPLDGNLMATTSADPIQPGCCLTVISQHAIS